MTFAKKLLIPNKWEYIVPALAIASLLISCLLISSKKFFWNDELYSYYLLADPSFTHMLGAFHDKINNTPPLYFILGWLWAKAFGSTELSLRLFSCLGMCIACVTVWITLRRTYNFWSASIGTLSIFCTSELILSQNAEARMYGLFMAICSFALLQFDLNNRISNCSSWTLFSNACIHAAMVHTHLFGLFYSGAIVCCHIVIDSYFKIFRPKLYLSIVLSWLSLILYIPSFLNQADAGNPRTWIPTPILKDLIDFFSLNSSLFIRNFILLLVILISGLQFIIYKSYYARSSEIEPENNHNLKAEISLLIFAYAFLIVPIFVWSISLAVKPIFWERYLIPTTLSWSILLAYLSSKIIFIPIFNHELAQKLRLSRVLVVTQRSILLSVLTATLLIHPISYGKNYQGRSLPGSNDNKYGYSNLPIVVQISAGFLERRYYSPERDRYFFILDWEAAVDKSSGQFGPQEYKHLDAIKRNYPELFQNHIVKSEEFLKNHKRFLVLDFLDYDQECPLKLIGGEKGKNWEDIHCPKWLEMRILNNPNYKVKPLGQLENFWQVLLVETKI